MCRPSPLHTWNADDCALLSRRPQSALSTITLKNAAGDSVTAYQFGACVTSYVKNGVDVLMVRPDAKLDGSKPISGGIPHCFPQFGPGDIQQHGFARNLDWEIAEQTDSSVIFRCRHHPPARYLLLMLTLSWHHRIANAQAD